MRRYWIGVASRDHVHAGVAGGFAQLGHGKHAPVARLSPGDRLVYYSPREQLGAGEPVQSFTAVGVVCDAPARQAAQADDFHPFRRDVRWLDAVEAPIGPLLPQLALTRGRQNWGLLFRRSLLAIEREDYRRIVAAMQARDDD